MAKTRAQIAKPDIVKQFDGLASRILKRSNIDQIVSRNRQFWRLAQRMSVNQFIKFMLAETILEEITLDFPFRKETRYAWGHVSPYGIALSLKEGGYFSHYTALFFHQLTEQVPKTIYLNHEQSPKPRGEALAQSRIDAAFKRPPRVSRNVASIGDAKICLLNGMHTGQLGVVEAEGPEGERIRVTDVERTLIDIAVRPTYSGGVFEVLDAYRMAKGKASVNKLAAMLKKLDYVYPYHQAIGFYLERAGVYKESSIRLLGKFEMAFDFYLTHQMENVQYSRRWRLFFPEGL